MKRISLAYVASYLFIGGVGFLFAPAVTLGLFFSNGDYGDVMPRLVGIFMLVTGVAMLTGYWSSSVEETEFSRRIKDIDNPIYNHNQGSAPQEERAAQWRSGVSNRDTNGSR